ncbi:MAG: tRNA (adenosine(37)-N6)-threonylcarbamoyltransferase complex transferase subunit TsaD [Candidatus Marinimicrobia bacterium]|nr:tRNA (adenosine(37)-N6)-threonylcarbamoyltransferase complex transferase subunit TsaD [Candidatus Neomarinimicrobiota bacterium]MBT3676270.1 tRNA (adenosine(37)-N6)-threonylcarbamoyltransferase complex transferase subunit TsaD [Candidatus Neomarinimicrobiota bacterium]MBT3763153.1 tRNA (adenosine(37)-N6)-threonylcarbamoyltransferase complex transferase subunit TsaD [Candidatus Neomarinimicrobiota bacterium]MBT4270820.1 tRNA (adenosine(37)-N6)-threonylcarbamoyltransferase complex transferase s
MIVLGIETSCDETAAAVSMDGSIISSQISTQTIHQKYGGVVPEIASREHEKLLNDMVSDTLKDAKISPQELEGIAVTQGPGLSGTLITGICFAKGLALGLGLPIIGVNHLEAHIFANFLADPALKFPFVCLLVSGGHTQLWHVKDVNDYSMLGESRDDAAGEAFDKGARILGLGYPGGPEIEKLSISGNRNAIKFPRALMKKGNLEFSFSGLKTSLLYYMDSHKNENMNDVAASYQQAIVDVLITKLKWAMKKTDCITCVIAGGVAANRSLRKNVELMLATEKVIFPELSLCTDNAAMIAYLGELYLSRGIKSNIDFPIQPNLKLA